MGQEGAQPLRQAQGRRAPLQFFSKDEDILDGDTSAAGYQGQAKCYDDGVTG
jgi:hypothetical protein